MSSATRLRTAPEDNPIIRMFMWWNQAFTEKDGYTADAFRNHYTEDAVLMKNGNVRGRGPQQLADHFRHLQQEFDHIEMVLPVSDAFVAGDRAFVQCITKAVKGDTVLLEEAMAAATIINNRMSRLVIIGRPMTEMPKE